MQILQFPVASREDSSGMRAQLCSINILLKICASIIYSTRNNNYFSVILMLKHCGNSK